MMEPEGYSGILVEHADAAEVLGELVEVLADAEGVTMGGAKVQKFQNQVKSLLVASEDALKVVGRLKAEADYHPFKLR